MYAVDHASKAGDLVHVRYVTNWVGGVTTFMISSQRPGTVYMLDPATDAGLRKSSFASSNEFQIFRRHLTLPSTRETCPDLMLAIFVAFRTGAGCVLSSQ